MGETRIRRPRVLVVDDDQPIRFMIRRVLERENCIVDTACDGFEAIEMMKKHDYSVIFLDMMLPEFDGYGVLRHIRNNDPKKLEDVVVMSALGAAGLTVPVRAVLTKPFDLDELLMHATHSSSEILNFHRQAPS
jgi:CheY-like chemotaxis protein